MQFRDGSVIHIDRVENVGSYQVVVTLLPDQNNLEKVGELIKPLHTKLETDDDDPNKETYFICNYTHLFTLVRYIGNLTPATPFKTH